MFARKLDLNRFASSARSRAARRSPVVAISDSVSPSSWVFAASRSNSRFFCAVMSERTLTKPPSVVGRWLTSV
jgi:hypothetical protein